MEVILFGKQFFINKILLICLVGFLIISSGILGYFLNQVYQPLSSPNVIESKTEIIQSKAAEPSEELAKTEEEPDIKVYVIGCVNKPGVVTIKKGQVIDDAIKSAGGATNEADIENINLAYKLNENAMLRIKKKVVNVAAAVSPKTNSKKEITTKSPINEKSNKTQQRSKISSKVDDSVVAATATTKMNSGVDIITDSLGAIVEEDKQNTGSKKENSLVNINKASQAELENLPNVGPATAKAIITYREKNGGFKKLTDIMKITGIKQKTYDKIKEFICIE